MTAKFSKGILKLRSFGILGKVLISLVGGLISYIVTFIATWLTEGILFARQASAIVAIMIALGIIAIIKNGKEESSENKKPSAIWTALGVSVVIWATAAFFMTDQSLLYFVWNTTANPVGIGVGFGLFILGIKMKSDSPTLSGVLILAATLIFISFLLVGISLRKEEDQIKMREQKRIDALTKEWTNFNSTSTQESRSQLTYFETWPEVTSRTTLPDGVMIEYFTVVNVGIGFSEKDANITDMAVKIQSEYEQLINDPLTRMGTFWQSTNPQKGGVAILLNHPESEIEITSYEVKPIRENGIEVYAIPTRGCAEHAAFFDIVDVEKITRRGSFERSHERQAQRIQSHAKLIRRVSTREFAGTHGVVSFKPEQRDKSWVTNQLHSVPDRGDGQTYPIRKGETVAIVETPSWKNLTHRASEDRNNVPLILSTGPEPYGIVKFYTAGIGSAGRCAYGYKRLGLTVRQFIPFPESKKEKEELRPRSKEAEV